MSTLNDEVKEILERIKGVGTNLTFEGEYLADFVERLDKLVDVIKVSEITSNEHIEREIAFVKINDKDINEKTMSEFSKNEFLKLHKTKKNEIIIECVDSPKKINDFIKSVKKIAVKIVRSGAVGINSN